MSLATEFVDRGYVVVPGVFSRQQIADLRDAWEVIRHEPSPYACDTTDFLIDFANRYDAFRQAAFAPGLLAALRDVLGRSLAWIPEHSIMAKYYRGGFHQDVRYYRRVSGDRTTVDDGWMLARPVIYLQGNDLLRGGGLDVMPGSHRGKPSQPVTVLHQPGDLVLFHLDCLHQGTPQSQSPDDEKVGLFLAVGPDDAHARRFARHLATADLSKYTDCLRPAVVHPETESLCAANNIKWLTGAEPCGE